MTEPTENPNLFKLSLENLDKIVDNSSEKNRNFFIAYLGLMIYVQAIIFSTSDLQLLLPSQQLKLPLIGIDVPLVGFYFTIPLFVIALHFNFLQNLESHHYKLMRWQQAQPGGVVPRSRVFPFLFDFAILETQSGFRNLVLWANNILCYNLAPLTLALLLFRFADRQDFPVTFWHYVCFVVDCYLVWRLRKALMHNAKQEEPSLIWLTALPPAKPNAVELNTKFWVRPFPKGGLWGILIKPFLTVWRLVVYFTEFVIGSFRYRPHGLIRLIVLAEVLITYAIAGPDDATFNRVVLKPAQAWANKNSRSAEWVLPRIKIDPNDIVWQADEKSLKIEAEMAGETNWVKYFDEKGKGFRPDPNSLRLVVLRGQKLPRAQLREFRLQGAELGGAELQRAELFDARLQGADLDGAQLQGADLRWAQMQGAILALTGIHGLLINHTMPVFGIEQNRLFDHDKTDWGTLEQQVDGISNVSTRQAYLQRLKAAQQPGQLNQARSFLPYQPRAIAPSAVVAICTSQGQLGGLLPRESRLSSALAFRNQYLNPSYYLKQNPDYPKVVQDIDYQLCTLPECQDIRG
ncbi:MAG: pentapeptide repeat-containing protein, partial [Candidatus Methylumidiphilus sp.]